MLLCDKCDKGFHMDTCLKPALARIPDGEWFCFECTALKSSTAEIKNLKVLNLSHDLTGNLVQLCIKIIFYCT